MIARSFSSENVDAYLYWGAVINRMGKYGVKL